MHDQPPASDLLTTARSVLLDQLLPTLAAEQRYTALMIANALIIASREQIAGSALNDARQSLLSRVDLDSDAVPVDEEQLCRALRAGRLDNQLLQLLDAFRDDIVARLSVSNPKYLQQVDSLQKSRTAAIQEC
ncbi:DUF6285 domain-containing protein [Pseudomonas sp. NFX15]|uniref:DUF6285 domain-containing protein n=1 Tax=Pseudomonas sp. NFX15 TaxID=2816958 RepID=UPI003B8C8758